MKNPAATSSDIAGHNHMPRFDTAPVAKLVARIRVVAERDWPEVEDDQMLGFDERDLLDFAEEAGFREIHLELQVAITPVAPRLWETMLHSAGNPLDPTLEEVIAQALTPKEARRYEAHLRPLVERGEGVERGAMAYLWAVKH
jgi:arsenite methyltransferase